MKLFLTLIALLFCTIVFSQEKNNPAGKNVNTYNDSLYNGLKWRCIGTYRGGRSLAVAGVKGDLMTYYAGACGGGLWKTTDCSFGSYFGLLRLGGSS